MGHYKYDRKAQLQAAGRAVRVRRTDPIIEEILGYWHEHYQHTDRHYIPTEPLAREWRAGNEDRQRRWADLNFHERHAVYRRINEIRDPHSGDIKKKAKR